MNKRQRKKKLKHLRSAAGFSLMLGYKLTKWQIKVMEKMISYKPAMDRAVRKAYMDAAIWGTGTINIDEVLDKELEEKRQWADAVNKANPTGLQTMVQRFEGKIVVTKHLPKVFYESYNDKVKELNKESKC